MCSLAVVTLTSDSASLHSGLLAFVHAYYLECFTLFSNKLYPSSTLCSIHIVGREHLISLHGDPELRGSWKEVMVTTSHLLFHPYIFKRNRNTHHLPFKKLQKVNIVYNVEFAPISLTWPILFSSTSKYLLKIISKCAFLQHFFPLLLSFWHSLCPRY